MIKESVTVALAIAWIVDEIFFITIANFYKSFLVHTPANRATVVKAKSVRTTIVETAAMAAFIQTL